MEIGQAQLESILGDITNRKGDAVQERVEIARVLMAVLKVLGRSVRIPASVMDGIKPSDEFLVNYDEATGETVVSMGRASGLFAVTSSKAEGIKPC